MQAPDPEVARLSIAGWIFMLSSLTFVLVLVLWCYRRLLTAPRTEPPKPVKDFHSA